MIRDPVLEVIACSVDDAIAAAEGGAGRLEVVRELERGGLTPPVDLVRDIQRAVSLPLRVMVRESDAHGYTVRDRVEHDALCAAAKAFHALGVDGLVLGFLTDGEVDLELTQSILDCAPGVHATFHHAFDDAADQLRALERLKRCPQVDRVLTSGGPGDLSVKRDRLVRYTTAGESQITALVGGGVDRMLIESLAPAGLREFHVGRAARMDRQMSGRVSAALVRALVDVLPATERSSLG
ncbi:MAG: copper homeostasis protein CutC [Kofleriaceae bacterium]